LEGEVRIAKTQCEAVERQSHNTAETLKVELGRVQKQFQGLDDQVKMFKQQIFAFDKKIADWKDSQLEAQLMHNEDLDYRIHRLQE